MTSLPPYGKKSQICIFLRMAPLNKILYSILSFIYDIGGGGGIMTPLKIMLEHSLCIFYFFHLRDHTNIMWSIILKFLTPRDQSDHKVWPPQPPLSDHIIFEQYFRESDWIQAQIS